MGGRSTGGTLKILSHKDDVCGFKERRCDGFKTNESYLAGLVQIGRVNWPQTQGNFKLEQAPRVMHK